MDNELENGSDEEPFEFELPNMLDDDAPSELDKIDEGLDDLSPGLDNLDDLFGGFDEDEFGSIIEISNILFIGLPKNFKKLNKIIGGSPDYNFKHAKTLEEASVFLLQDVFAIIIFDNEDENIELEQASTSVRKNHPLARLILFSKKRASSFVASILNNALVDVFLPHNYDQGEILNLIIEQQAKHEISKMITSFASEPPKLSKASYLLLDPSLSFADENLPCNFVGIMFAYNSVPRFSKWFETVLQKDEILFSGYLAGIAMLGEELFQNDEPLKEINFGGISVIFRFDENLQTSIFVRNLTRHNFQKAEEKIDKILKEIKENVGDNISAMNIVTTETIEFVNEVTKELAEAAVEEEVIEEQVIEKDHLILIYGADIDNLNRIKKHLEKKLNFNVLATDDESVAHETMKNPLCKVLMIDSHIGEDENRLNPLYFAEIARETIPYNQIIYMARDRRASSPIIKAMNTGVINYLVAYKIPLKEHAEWVNRALIKAQDLIAKSSNSDGLGGSSDQALIAKTMIRKNEEAYMSDAVPQLDGILITMDHHVIFQSFWHEVGGTKEFDQEMMAGLIASLDSVGGEMFTSEQTIGSLELGGAQVLLQQREKYKIIFFIENVDPNTSVVVDKEVQKGATRLYYVIQNTDEDLYSYEIQSNFKEIADQIYKYFNEKFS